MVSTCYKTTHPSTHSTGGRGKKTWESGLDEEIIARVSSDSEHSMRSMLAGRPAQTELFNNTISQRWFKIRAAESPRERRSASALLERMYATRGYQSTALSDEESPNRKTFLASDHNVALGTLTIGLDSTERLMVDSLFSGEVDVLRTAGLQICEFTKLAMDRRARSPRLLAALFHVAYIYAHRIKGLHNLLIEVNPRHVRYYQEMLGFSVIGTEKHNLRVNAPAVLLSLDLCYAQEQIGIFGGKPQMATTERSAYPYFFSVSDEAGIVGRLHRTDADIAHVFETDTGRNGAPRADASRH